MTTPSSKPRKRRKKGEQPSGPALDPRAVLAALGGIDEKTIERANESVRKFRLMLPSLNAYAKAVTKNPKVRVEMWAGTPCTDGETIYLRPPIELGDNLTHDRPLCDQRDDDGVLVCPACRNRENIDITIRHEIAHICFDSFANMAEDEKMALLDRVLEEAGAADGTSRAAKLKERLERMKPENYVAANAAISPFLPGIFNGLEDARVNIAMYKSRPGTFKMFKAQATEVFQEGMQDDLGNWVAWRDLPGNAQVTVGLYAKASGLEYQDWFDDDVCEALADPEIAKQIRVVQNAKSARTIYKVGFPVLETLRKYGFCVAEDDPEAEEEPGPGEDGDCDGESSEGTPVSGGGSSRTTDGTSGESDTDDSDKQDGPDGPTRDTDETETGKADDGDDDGASDDDEAEDGSGGEADDGDATDEGADGDGDSGDEDDGDDGSGDSDSDADGDGRGDPADVEKALEAFGGHEAFGTPRAGGGVGALPDDVGEEKKTPEQQEVDRAIVQGEHFDAPTRTVFGVNIWNNLDATAPGWEDDTYYAASTYEVEQAPESVLAPALQAMRVVFCDNKKARYERNLKAGRISARTLGRRSAVSDPRIFQKKREPGRRDYFVVLGLDISGSTASGGRLPLIKSAAYAQAELLHRLGIKFAIYAHTGTHHGRGYTGYGGGLVDVDIHVVKDPKEKWCAATKARLSGLRSAQANLDGHSMEFYRKVCDRSQETDKLILYYTDGQMPAENYDDELEVLQREIRNAPLHGVKIVGIGVQNEDPIKHGLDTIRIDTLEDVPRVVLALKERLTKP